MLHALIPALLGLNGTGIVQDPPPVFSLGEIAARGSLTPGELIIEPHIAASASRAMVVFKILPGGGSVRTGYAVYNGSSWKEGVYNQTGLRGADHTISYDPVTDLFVEAHFTGSSLHLNRFSVHGFPPLVETTTTFLIPPSGIDKPYLIRGRDLGTSTEFHVTLIRKFNNLFVTYTADGGDHWDTPSSTSFATSFAPQPTVSSDGTLYISFPPTPNSTSYSVIRSDGAGNFEELLSPAGVSLSIPINHQVSDTLGSEVPGVSRTQNVAYLLADPTSTDRLFFLYQDVSVENGDDVDIYCRKILRTSNDRWLLDANRIRVNNDPLSSEDKDQFCPSAAVDSAGRLHVAFYDDRNYDFADNDLTAQFDATYAVSTDQGASFANYPLMGNLTEPLVDEGLIPGGLGSVTAEYCGVWADNNTVWVAIAGTSSTDLGGHPGVIYAQQIQF